MAEQALDLSLEALARAADLCHPPWQHAVRVVNPETQGPDEAVSPGRVVLDLPLRLEARDGDGSRRPEHDLELELYRSGASLNLMLIRVQDEEAPILWHGNHPLWIQAADGRPCERPPDGAPLEALCRRVRALLSGD